MAFRPRNNAYNTYGPSRTPRPPPVFRPVVNNVVNNAPAFCSQQIPGNSYSRNSIRQGVPLSGQSFPNGPNQTATSSNRNMNIIYSPSNNNVLGVSSMESKDKFSDKSRLCNEEAATSRPSILKRPYESEPADVQRTSVQSSLIAPSVLRTNSNRPGDERSDSNSKTSLVPRMNTVKPTKVPLPIRSSKKVEDDEEDDEDDTCNESQCKLCNVTFESGNAYHVHIRLTSHLQKSMLYKEKRLSSSCVQNVTLNELHCNICNFTFSSKQVFNCHLHGLAHQAGLKQIKDAHDKQIKEKEKLELINKLKQEAKLTRNRQHVEALEYLEANNLIEEDMVFGNDIFCKVCEVKCSGFISYKNHLDGVKHKKKLKLIGSGYPSWKFFIYYFSLQ
ncbi:hypothetical protein HELRODRAFT_163550 [Helobdella robusta]|uniref:C2H2-type domain-containing protein n=1 Tax=Helobdella robusta TaxID=6412 RepID=T1EU70_HELRO|nr:hypothetical protein HELRODRAFT_163550 [Helobdella robusta]ESN96483.1 hypothetical protein HELRODRAFT_163550 [Helobdella robusta]